MARLEKVDKVLEELVAVLVDELLRVLADDEHLAHVALGLGVQLVAIGVAHLPLADLAVPSQPLETFALELIAQVLGRPDLGLGHGGGVMCTLGWREESVLAGTAGIYIYVCV